MELSPEDPAAYHARGYAYAEMGARHLAVEDFGRAVALNPEDVDSRRNRAALNRELGQPEKAIADYDEIIRLRPGDSWTIQARRRAVEEAEGR